MKGKGIYQVKSSEKEIKEYTLSVLTEDKAGLLNHITIIFNRRKININSLNVSTTEVNGVSRFTIVVNSSKEKIVKVVNHINKLIEVLGAFLYEENEIYFQEIALYKLSSKIFMKGDIVEKIIRKYGAKILVIEKNHTIIQKTGSKDETQSLYNELDKFNGILEFARSGRVALSKKKRKTINFLKQLEKTKSNKLNI
ncbi:MAG: acetolactate synthase small subunit [Cytophagia bacterium]|nr:acetolactate synthase small subunit [Cytophagia bacterium]|tara:strand:+ start:433 stop:1023 length:591 start_codon:yes stop_codon:yes gene_type:complete